RRWPQPRPPCSTRRRGWRACTWSPPALTGGPSGCARGGFFFVTSVPMAFITVIIIPSSGPITYTDPRTRPIVVAMFTALTDPTGVTGRRPGALARIGWVLDDLVDTRRRLAGAEARMVTILDQLGLTDLVCSIPGVS